MGQGTVQFPHVADGDHLGRRVPAQHGEVDDAAFLGCVADSLPCAWSMITGLITDLEASGGQFADNQVPPPDEEARGQLCG
jgi:hypothetical protein